MHGQIPKVAGLALSILLAFTGNWSAAQDATEVEKHIDELSLDDLMNNTVTSASKVKQKQSEAPSIIAVIPREQFYDYGWFTLNDAMNHQAGFFSSHDYDRRVIGSRGLFEGWNNNHLLHLVDGVPFNDPMYGTAYTWENTPIFMIKSVEVIRGPGSALYGTNATNGVIAVKTLSGEDMNGRAEGRIRYGSAESVWMEAYTGNTTGNFSYFTGFSNHSTDGNSYMSADGSERTNADGTAAKFNVRDDRSARYFLFKADGLNELKDWSFQYHDQSWRFQTGHGWLWQAPDYADAMYEHRRLLTVSYKPTFSDKVSSEFTLKFERKEIDWFTRYGPDDAYAGAYPNGISEYVNFYHDNLFGRGQLTWDLGEQANFLFGIETSVFVYNGDKEHFSNTDLTDPNLPPTAGGEWMAAPPILGLIKDKPITNIGLYSQLLSGSWISSKLPVTLGLRYDRQTVNFRDGTGAGERTFDQLSPRLGVVWLASDRYSLKFLAGRAFRAPSPSELAGTGTWALANNIRELEPETVTTFELGSDWRVTDRVTWKINAYHTQFEDQIGYSLTNANLSTNIYTTTTAGAETELNVLHGRFKSFANASYAQRLDEDISDTSVTEEDTVVTWAPSVTGNLGTTATFGRWKFSGIAEYMHQVHRRASDKSDFTNSERGSSVDAWYGLNAAAHYALGKDSNASLYVNNILDSEGHLIKNRQYPFDYQRDGRTYYMSVSHRF